MRTKKVKYESILVMKITIEYNNFKNPQKESIWSYQNCPKNLIFHHAKCNFGKKYDAERFLRDSSYKIAPSSVYILRLVFESQVDYNQQEFTGTKVIM